MRAASLTQCLAGCVALLLVQGTPARAVAQRTPTCVEVDISGVSDTNEAQAEKEALERLVESELDRHPTHVHGESGCESDLLVELIEVKGQRFVTGRINWQVPHRIEISGGDLEGAVERLLKIVLHNDPIHLRGPESRRGVSGALHRLKNEAQTLWGLEVYEQLGVIDREPHAATGLAFRIRRELMQWQVGVRLGFAARPSPLPDTELGLRAIGHLSAELAYFFADRASTSAYVMTALGIAHHWFRGPVEGEPNNLDSANHTGLVAGFRGGVELLRTSTTRMDLFAQVSLPMFVTQDEAQAVMKRWFPTLTLGAGLAF